MWGIARRGRSAGEAHDLRGPAPELFQAVVLPLIRCEDVNDEIAEVEQQPATIGRTLFVPKVHAIVRQFALQMVRQCVKVEGRLRRGDHKIVRKARCLGDIEQDDIQRLPVRENVDGPVGQCFGLQTLPLTPPVGGSRT